MKGVAGTFGALDLQREAGALNAACRDGADAVSETAVSALRDLAEKVFVELDQIELSMGLKKPE